jgi:hypothetical protein
MKNISMRFNVIIVLLAILIVLSGCAAQHKYKRVKAVPCPCEKENKK